MSAPGSGFKSFVGQGSTKRRKSGASQQQATTPTTPTFSTGRSPTIALTADCLYSMQEPSATHLGQPQQFHRPSQRKSAEPMLVRFLRCSAVLPNIPLQNATRVIAMFKCFRKVQPAGSRSSTAPTIETLYSHFSRIWPKESDTQSNMAVQEERVQSLVLFDKNCRVDFILPVAADLPQSLSIPGGGSIYYTLQIQANLMTGAPRTGEASIYSQELVVNIPAPESAYSPARLPRRITTAHMTGTAQDHFGILITPDISLHVSVPQEILYARNQHSVFKIHLKLMPHPPEAKLPAIAKLDWKLTQRVQIGQLAHKSNGSDWPSAGAWPESPNTQSFSAATAAAAAANGLKGNAGKKQAKLGESNAILASGTIAFAQPTETTAPAASRQGRFSSVGKQPGTGAAAQARHAAAQASEHEAQQASASGTEDAMMGGSRKDQYLYIALPEQSAALQPMSEGNPFLEILHQLEIELFPFHPNGHAPGSSSHGPQGFNPLSKTFWNWKKSVSAWGKKTAGSGAHAFGGGASGQEPGNATSARDRWQAEIPVKITLAFDQHEKLMTAASTMTPAAQSITGTSPALSQGSVGNDRAFTGPSILPAAPGFGHGGPLAITTGA